MWVFFAERQHNFFKCGDLFLLVVLLHNERKQLHRGNIRMAEGDIDDKTILPEQSHHKDLLLIGELILGKGDGEEGGE